MFTLTLALLVFLLPLAWSPGPGNMVFAAIGARDGLAASWPASLGYHLATWVVTAAIGLGFATITQAAPGLMRLISLAGAGYVLRLAWRFWQAGRLGAMAPTGARTGIGDGAALLLFNAKAYVIIAAMFSQFLPADADWRLVLWITTVFTLHNLLAFTCWTWAGDVILRRYRTPRSARLLNRVCGLLLAGIALWMALR